MFARDTYEVGTESVSKPEDLRRFNELLHRISCKQLDFCQNETGGMPDQLFFQMVGEALEELHVDSGELIKRLR
jgi:hypothetical protein